MRSQRLVAAFLFLLSLMSAPPAARAVGFDLGVSVVGTNQTTSVFAASGTSLLMLAPQSAYGYECNGNGLSVPIAKLDLTVGQDVQAPDPFDATVKVTLTMTDYNGSQTGKLTFDGKVQGAVTQRSSTLNIVWQNAATQTVTLSGLPFTVTMGPASMPGPPIGVSTGYLSAFITCGAAATSVQSVAISPSPVKTGRYSLGTAALNNPAPRDGAMVNLTSSAAGTLSVPASVFIPEGATSATFAASGWPPAPA